MMMPSNKGPEHTKMRVLGTNCSLRDKHTLAVAAWVITAQAQLPQVHWQLLSSHKPRTKYLAQKQKVHATVLEK